MVTTAVTCRPKRCIPYPLLHENTLLLSDNLVVNIVRGRLRLMFRCLGSAFHHACHVSILCIVSCVDCMSQAPAARVRVHLCTCLASCMSQAVSGELLKHKPEPG